MNFDFIDLKRREQNLTVTKLCEIAGIDRGTYSKMKAQPDAIKLSTFVKICDALEFSKDERAKAIM